MMGVPMIKWLVYRFYSGKSHFLMDDLSLFWIGFVHYNHPAIGLPPIFRWEPPPPSPNETETHHGSGWWLKHPATSADGQLEI